MVSSWTSALISSVVIPTRSFSPIITRVSAAIWPATRIASISFALFISIAMERRPSYPAALLPLTEEHRVRDRHLYFFGVGGQVKVHLPFPAGGRKLTDEGDERIADEAALEVLHDAMRLAV